MAYFTGKIVDLSDEYGKLHQMAVERTGFKGSLEDYMNKHGLSPLAVTFDRSMHFSSDGRKADGAYVTAALDTSGLSDGDAVSGKAIRLGGGLMVTEIRKLAP